MSLHFVVTSAIAAIQPLYGNSGGGKWYGGGDPNWSAHSSDPKVAPIDDMDAFFKAHDQTYYSAKANSADSHTLELSNSVPNHSAELNLLEKLAEVLTELIDFYRNKKENQPASQSASACTSPFTDQSTETPADVPAENYLQTDLKLLLKGMGSGPWPELLFSELGKVLSPHQVSVIEERSPWSAEGAWAILEAIRVLGHGLDQKAGTLWNALLKHEKGVHWLAKAGPRSAKVSGDGIEPETGPGATGDEPKAHEHRSCPPTPETFGEERPGLQNHELRGTPDVATQERKECMTRQGGTHVHRPEDFSPQMKAQLRFLIGHSRQALSACLQGPSPCPLAAARVW